MNPANGLGDGDDQRRRLEARDRAAIVDEWMAVQLLTERQMYGLLRGPLAQRLRQLSLLELDVITQLEEGGQSALALAATLQVDDRTLQPATDRLLRQRLLARQGRGGEAPLRRTADADQLVALLRHARADLMVGILRRMPAQLQGRTMELMQALLPTPPRPTKT